MAELDMARLRESAAKLKTVSIPTALAMTGLMLLFGDVGVAMADVPIGPGPANYTEQPQPPPGTCHYRTAANGETLPDPNCTPGAISPKVTQDTLATTICKTGYTKSIRPPASITAAEKRGNAAAIARRKASSSVSATACGAPGVGVHGGVAVSGLPCRQAIQASSLGS